MCRGGRTPPAIARVTTYRHHQASERIISQRGNIWHHHDRIHRGYAMTVRHHSDSSASYRANSSRDTLANAHASDSLHTTLLQLNRHTFAQGRYLTAYHALAAALYAADEDGDVQRMQEVGVVAREQAEWLAAHARRLPSALQGLGPDSIHARWQSVARDVEVKLRRLAQTQRRDVE